MNNRNSIFYLLVIAILFSCQLPTTRIQTSNVEPLDLWNEGKVKNAIVSFVDKVTSSDDPDFLPEAERVAVFDMDGTILIEKPNYVLFDFALRRMMKQIDTNPKLKEKQPYKAIYEQDWHYFETVDIFSDEGLYSVLLYATDGYTEEQYREAVLNFFNTVKDERYGISYNQLVYAPVVQLIKYLQEKQFEVYIVSGSDPQFTRAFCKSAANIPVNNVIGTTVLSKWEQHPEGSVFVRQHAFVKPINDKEGKPVNILNKIGKQPVFAVGNSGGDYHMLEYSKSGKLNLQLIVNHDDAEREYAYNAEKMKTMCQDNEWLEISMKNDFKIIFKEN